MAEESSTSPAAAPASQASQAGPLLLLEVIRVFATRIWIFSAVAAVVLVVTVYHTMRSTPIYSASAQVLLERQYQRMREFDDPVTVDTEQADYYNTQYSIMSGPGLAANVAAAVRPEDHPAYAGQDSVGVIMKGLRVDSGKMNRVVEISFESPDPKFAAEVVNTVIAEYRKDCIKRRKDTIDELSSQMQTRLLTVKKDLEANERALMDFYRNNSLLLSEEHQGGYTRAIDEMNSVMQHEGRELARLEAIATQVEASLFDLKKLSTIEGVIDNSQLIYMKLEEQKASQEFEEAKKKYQTKHPAYIASEVKLKEATKKIDDQVLQIAKSHVLHRDAKRQSVRSLQEQLEGLRKKQGDRDTLIVEADRMRRDRDGNRSLYDTLKLRVKESEISSSIPMTNIHVLSAAEGPDHPIRPDLLRNLMLGIVLALIFGSSVVLVLEKLDNRVHTPQDVEDVYGLPVLAVIPERKPDEAAGPAALVCWQEESSKAAEGYRQLRAAVLLSMREGSQEGGQLRTIVCASPGPGDGKTVTAVNLAISLAQTGEKTLLLDTDFHRSDAHKVFGLDRDKGLSTLLTSDVPFAHVIQPTPVPFLDMMTTGMIPPQPASLLGSARMKWILQEAAKHYNRIIIDTPPLAAVTDGAMLAPLADALLLVLREGKTQKTALRRAILSLSRIGVKPLGAVFNGMTGGFSEMYFKYQQPVYNLERLPAPRETEKTI